MAPIELHATNTHLYRGARLRTPLPPGTFPREPRAVRLIFSDGVGIDAELLQNVDDDALAVEVPAYRTAAGQEIAAKLWRIAAVDAEGDGSVIRIGAQEG